MRGYGLLILGWISLGLGTLGLILWASIVGSAVVFGPYPAGDIAMILAAVLITLYILRLPTAQPCDWPQSMKRQGCG